MLITEHFVFVHIPKTGGSFVRELCRRHLSPIREFNHRSYRKVPPEFATLPALTFVRNPWDWYVSWYHYSLAQKPKGFAWEEILKGGRASFGEAVTASCTLRAVDSTTHRPGPLWFRTMQERDCDQYTALHDLMTADSPRVEVGKFESLRADLIAFMDRHGVPIDDAFREDVIAMEPVYPPFGSPERGSYQSHYDDHLRSLVASNCPLIARYGYSFEGETR